MNGNIRNRSAPPRGRLVATVQREAFKLITVSATQKHKQAQSRATSFSKSQASQQVSLEGGYRRQQKADKQPGSHILNSVQRQMVRELTHKNKHKWCWHLLLKALLVAKSTYPHQHHCYYCNTLFLQSKASCVCRINADESCQTPAPNKGSPDPSKTQINRELNAQCL